MFEKQKLLFDLSKKSKTILEIGVYMGHSLLIILLANPKAKITCIDIDDTFPDYIVKNKDKFKVWIM